MKISLSFLIFLSALYSCGQVSNTKSNYPENVGDIAFDEKIDDPNFKICQEDNVFQYYNFSRGFQYKGEKVKVNEHFQNGFKGKEKNRETGFLTIRFIVNCEGKTGRFRVQGMDINYNAMEFHKELVNDLLTLTKTLDGWIVGEIEGLKTDYYQYLTFKLENGKLIEIMP
jgi:hypothetical protein